MHVRFQLWCAAAVNVTASRTRDGGSIVGTSVFYSDVTDDDTLTPLTVNDEVERLNQELQVSLLADFVCCNNVNGMISQNLTSYIIHPRSSGTA